MTIQKRVSDGSVATTMSTSADQQRRRVRRRSGRRHRRPRRCATAKDRQDDDHREQERPRAANTAPEIVMIPTAMNTTAKNARHPKHRCALRRRRLRTPRRHVGVASNCARHRSQRPVNIATREQAEQDRPDGLTRHLAVLVENHVRAAISRLKTPTSTASGVNHDCVTVAHAARKPVGRPDDTRCCCFIARPSSTRHIRSPGNSAQRATGDRHPHPTITSRRCSRAARRRRTRSRRVARRGDSAGRPRVYNPHPSLAEACVTTTPARGRRVRAAPRSRGRRPRVRLRRDR